MRGGPKSAPSLGAGAGEKEIYDHIIGSDEADDALAFRSLGRISLADDAWPAMGVVVAGSVSFFGVVVEFDEGLAVVTSDNVVHGVMGPVTRWRVFPRSVHYENQLHAILDDKLEIYSFNDDYFVGQDAKKAGLRYDPRTIEKFQA